VDPAKKYKKICCYYSTCAKTFITEHSASIYPTSSFIIMTSEDNVTTVRAVSRDLFSATIGSVCCCYVGQPFDTVKVRMQTSPDLFSSVVGSTTSIIRNEGIPALWKGAVPTAGGMVLENCMAFGVNAALKRAFPTDPAQKALGGPPDLFQPFVMVGSV
jgi:hypothetical protein